MSFSIRTPFGVEVSSRSNKSSLKLCSIISRLHPRNNVLAERHVFVENVKTWGALAVGHRHQLVFLFSFFFFFFFWLDEKFFADTLDEISPRLARCTVGSWRRWEISESMPSPQQNGTPLADIDANIKALYPPPPIDQTVHSRLIASISGHLSICSRRLIGYARHGFPLLTLPRRTRNIHVSTPNSFCINVRFFADFAPNAVVPNVFSIILRFQAFIKSR